MISIDTNIGGVVDEIYVELKQLDDKDKVLRVVANSMVAVVHDRIHKQGKDANDAEIGTYSNSYLSVRKKNNRTNDKKVVLSLTRQMENDFSVIATDDGYGLGYKNELNFEKSKWVEKNYNKDIFKLTENEEKQVVGIAEFEVNRILNG